MGLSVYAMPGRIGPAFGFQFGPKYGLQFGFRKKSDPNRPPALPTKHLVGTQIRIEIRIGFRIGNRIGPITERPSKGRLQPSSESAHPSSASGGPAAWSLAPGGPGSPARTAYLPKSRAGNGWSRVGASAASGEREPERRRSRSGGSQRALDEPGLVRHPAAATARAVTGLARDDEAVALPGGSATVWKGSGWRLQPVAVSGIDSPFSTGSPQAFCSMIVPRRRACCHQGHGFVPSFSSPPPASGRPKVAPYSLRSRWDITVSTTTACRLARSAAFPPLAPSCNKTMLAASATASGTLVPSGRGG